MRFLRRAAPPLLLSAASILVVFLVAEAVARAASVSVGTVQINRGVVRVSADPRLGFELRPDSFVSSEVDYRINADGFRGPALQPRRSGTRRVAVFGDSIVFGYWVAEGDAFPAQLGAILGPAAETLNLGVPGYNLDQEIENLRKRVDSLQPDAVVFGFCLNDLEGLLSFEYGLTQARRDARSGPRRALESLLSVSRFAAWIEYRLTERDARASFARSRNPFGGELYEATPQALDAHLAASFTALALVLKPRGIMGAIAIFPILGNKFENYPYRDLHSRIARAAQNAGLLSVDLLPCFSSYPFRDVRVDVVHPNPMGHRIAAHAAADALFDALLPGQKRPPALDRSCSSYRSGEFAAVRGY
ncbi:MAG: SGNH/GDSL hydrolase family protein [Vicinamibacteria bacterium]|nr:SGNH/GDSL hydrolase family protein [Vicinamibacteria bacterium]